MIRQISVELTRFRSRRVASLMLLATVLIAVVGVARVSWDTRPLTDQDRKDAAAQTQMDAEKAGVSDQILECQKTPDQWLGPGATADNCAEQLTPKPVYPRHDLVLPRLIRESHAAIPRDGNTVALLVAAMMIISAAMFAGGGYSSGSLTTQLTFQPRRAVLWTAKVLAVAIWTLLHATLVIGGFWLALYLIADARGLTPTGEQLQTVSLHGLRAVLLAVGAAMGAFALTVLLRNTVAALVLVFISVVGGEILVNLLPISGAGRWSLGNNAMGWLVPQHRYFDATIRCGVGEQCTSMQSLSHLQAGLYLLILLLVVLAVSVLAFRRQDI